MLGRQTLGRVRVLPLGLRNPDTALRRPQAGIFPPVLVLRLELELELPC